MVKNITQPKVDETQLIVTVTRVIGLVRTTRSELNSIRQHIEKLYGLSRDTRGGEEYCTTRSR